MMYWPSVGNASFICYDGTNFGCGRDAIFNWFLLVIVLTKQKKPKKASAREELSFGFPYPWGFLNAHSGHSFKIKTHSGHSFSTGHNSGILAPTTAAESSNRSASIRGNGRCRLHGQGCCRRCCRPPRSRRERLFNLIAKSIWVFIFNRRDHSHFCVSASHWGFHPLHMSPEGRATNSWRHWGAEVRQIILLLSSFGCRFAKSSWNGKSVQDDGDWELFWRTRKPPSTRICVRGQGGAVSKGHLSEGLQFI
jgi:hypothetical protein